MGVGGTWGALATGLFASTAVNPDGANGLFFGNPYQLWFGKPEIESLGDKRYEVHIAGAGARVFLEDELHRFLAFLEVCQLGTQPDPTAGAALVETYLQGYQAEVKRKVGRYRSKLRRIEGDTQ